MPLKRQIGTRDIHTDLRRINTNAGLGSGAVSPHALLGPKQSDTVVTAPVQGALILADATSEWNILLHSGTAGHALVTGAATLAWDATPTWADTHTFQGNPGVTVDPQADQDHNLLTVNVTGTPTIKWDESEDSLSQSHDLILEKRTFGFAKVQDENGRIGNGPCEYGEVIAVGGVLEIAPAAALYAAVTIT